MEKESMELKLLNTQSKGMLVSHKQCRDTSEVLYCDQI